MDQRREFARQLKPERLLRDCGGHQQGEAGLPGALSGGELLSGRYRTSRTTCVDDADDTVYSGTVGCVAEQRSDFDCAKGFPLYRIRPIKYSVGASPGVKPCPSNASTKVARWLPA